eukprot:UN10932
MNPEDDEEEEEEEHNDLESDGNEDNQDIDENEDIVTILKKVQQRFSKLNINTSTTTTSNGVANKEQQLIDQYKYLYVKITVDMNNNNNQSNISTLQNNNDSNNKNNNSLINIDPTSPLITSYNPLHYEFKYNLDIFQGISFNDLVSSNTNNNNH